MFESLDMAEQQLAVGITEMHATTFAITEILAGGTCLLLHPAAVTIGMIAVFPYLHEVVVVDVTLFIVAANAGAGRDGAVYQYGTDGDACLAGIEVVAHFAFVVSQKAFTAVGGDQ